MSLGRTLCPVPQVMHLPPPPRTLGDVQLEARRAVDLADVDSPDARVRPSPVPVSRLAPRPLGVDRVPEMPPLGLQALQLPVLDVRGLSDIGRRPCSRA